jgi:hypothetical protein
MSEQPVKPRGTGKVRPAQDVGEALQKHAPWRPVECSPEDIGALQAMYRGAAEPYQQKRVLDFIIELSRNHGAQYFPGENGRRDTDFALGRAFVADQLVTLLKVKLQRSTEHG